MRSTRPAAIASLPSLLANAQGEPTYTQGNRNGHVNGARGQMNGHAHGGGGASGYAPMPHTAAVVPKAIIDDGSQPILPPRPTGRMMTAAREGGWFSRNWPLLVIATACVAILVALVLMVVPHLLTKDKDAGVKGNKLTPAPERMDTDPLVPKDPRGSTDPWKNGDPKPDIDIPDDPDVKDPDDPPAGGAATLQGSGAIMMGMVRHACDRAQTCGKLDDERLKEYCEETKKWPVAPPPASCPSAQRCFNHIDQMSCSAGFDDISALTAVMHKFEDCVEAISCS